MLTLTHGLGWLFGHSGAWNRPIILEYDFPKSVITWYFSFTDLTQYSKFRWRIDLKITPEVKSSYLNKIQLVKIIISRNHFLFSSLLFVFPSWIHIQVQTGPLFVFSRSFNLRWFTIWLKTPFQFTFNFFVHFFATHTCLLLQHPWLQIHYLRPSEMNKISPRAKLCQPVYHHEFNYNHLWPFTYRYMIKIVE